MKVRVTMRMSRRLQTQLQTCYTAVWRCSLLHTARLLKKSLASSAGGINELKMSRLEHWCIIQFNCPTALVCDGPICRKQVDRGNFKYCSYWMIKINIATSNSQRKFVGPPCISKLESTEKMPAPDASAAYIHQSDNNQMPGPTFWHLHIQWDFKLKMAQGKRTSLIIFRTLKDHC